ncbi:folate family ECF transporter S component [Lactococcus nasutitermitis]|uniref:Folate family ECF transporter S component n=1 Tax=Lactococcus nasutitermitis TaxID=1652957 RepID=A0ABV9JA67_9LACT|nr:folate family ECF transporter S component [Lactococcus nasutitermitis]
MNFRLKISLRTFVLLAILLAAGIVLGRFSLGNSLVRVSPNFVTNVLIGAVAGPLWSGIVLALGDIIGVLFSGAAYFPGFTFSAFLVGLLYGGFFFKKKLNINRWQDWLYTLFAFIILMFVETTTFDTLWIWMIMPTHTWHSFEVLFKLRLFLLIQIPIKTVVIMLIVPTLQKIKTLNKILS